MPDKWEEGDTSERRQVRPKVEQKYTEPDPAHKPAAFEAKKTGETVKADLDDFFGESESKPQEEEYEYEYEEVDDN